jgi:hypothetical protein
MAVQSQLTEPQEALRLTLLAQGGIALAALERATGHFEQIYAGVSRLPGAAELQKQIKYLREEQAKLKSTIEQVAALFKQEGSDGVAPAAGS